MTISNILTDHGVLEARLASRLVSSLLAAELPHDVNERLRVAREQAVARARLVRQVVAPQVSSSLVLGTTRDGAATLGGSPLRSSSGGRIGRDQGDWSNWLVSVLPLLLLVAGLLLISQWTAHEQMLVAAEIDTLLLADDLPPAAYADPGFAEFLRSGPQR